MIVYDPKEKTLSSDGVKVTFYCGPIMDEYSHIFAQLMLGKYTPLEAFEEFKSLRASCPLTVEDIKSAIEVQLKTSLDIGTKKI